VARWRGEEGNLIMILHAIQNQYGYVPREVAMELSRELGVKLARIYEVITFYHYFKLQPPGKHTVTVCNGTACYLKGAPGLLNELRNQLGVGEGQTTPDREFQVEVVRCIGCCGMAPAVVCDGKTHGRVKPPDLAGIIANVRAKAKEVAK
jgi:NADH-quinone oxidoreductase subunit E